MKKLILLLKTVMNLKPVQVYGRLLFKFRKIGNIPEYLGSPLIPKTELVDWCPRPRSFSENKVCFLNEEGGRPEKNWNPEGKSHLWKYNLNYFEDLLSGDRRDHKDLIRTWIKFNPKGTGCGWEPYPLSLRIVNWIKWLLKHKERSELLITESLHAQAYYLCNSIEYHLLGNHLFVNGKALVFAGLYLQYDVFLRNGLEIVTKELKEQLWEDGAHFENTPMYHSLFLEDVLDLINIMRSYGNEIPSSWMASVEQMMVFLDGMTHTDGEISHFNDSAIGIAPSPPEIFEYARRLGFSFIPKNKTMFFGNSGYLSYKDGEHVLIADAGPIGPRHIFGHGHCDNLSFEISGPDGRVFTNSGISEYGISAERLRQRQTRAHNCIILNGKEISEVWSGFRVARQAHPVVADYYQTEVGAIFTCTHDAYLDGHGFPVHTRQFELEKGYFLIRDSFTPGKYKSGEAHFHIHPQWVIEQKDPSAFKLTMGGRLCYWITSSWPVLSWKIPLIIHNSEHALVLKNLWQDSNYRLKK